MTSEFAIAVHAMVFLNHTREPVPSTKLGASICTNPARVRKIMTKLKKAGLVETKEGVGGGYFYSGDPKELTLDQICEAVKGQLVSSTWKTGNQNMDCIIGSEMADIMDEIYEKLDKNCKEQLKGISIDRIDRKIFRERK